jgi:hypothetical protein
MLMTAIFGLLTWQIIDSYARLGGLVAGSIIGLHVLRNSHGELPLPLSPTIETLALFAKLCLFPRGFTLRQLIALR